MRTSLLLTLLGLFLLVPAAYSQLLVQENFAYGAGTDLTASGNWTAHSGAGATPVKVVAQNLTFAGYPSTGGNAVYLTGGPGSREDVNRTFPGIMSGSVYASALVRVDSAGTDGEYFFHFGPDPVGSTFRGRVFIRDQGTGFQFGITKASSTVANVVWDPATYSFGTTYLIVLKYTIVAGDANDTASLYVFKPGDAIRTEPAAPNANASDTNGSDITPATISLRQGGSGSPAQPSGLTLDGLRITTSFASIATGNEAPSIANGAHLDVLGAHPASLVRVRLTTPAPGAVRLDAFDLLGRRVATLLDDALAAGEAREVTLGGLPAGVYVLRATGSGFSASRPVVIR
jgi:hypothetical protein